MCRTQYEVTVQEKVLKYQAVVILQFPNLICCFLFGTCPWSPRNALWVNADPYTIQRQCSEKFQPSPPARAGAEKSLVPTGPSNPKQQLQPCTQHVSNWIRTEIEACPCQVVHLVTLLAWDGNDHHTLPWETRSTDPIPLRVPYSGPW